MDKYTPYIFPALLIAWILYRRVRRTIGFQKYSPNSLIFRIIVFSIIALFLLAFALFNPMALLYDGIGLALGFGLVLLAVRHAVFEKRAKGLYYRTHIWVEMTVLTLFFARFLYRLYQFYPTIGHGGQSPDDLSGMTQRMKDPATGIMFSILCAFYIGYCSYIYRTGRLKLMETDAGEITVNSFVP